MKQIIVFPRGQLSPKDRKAMRDAGVLVVEADDPKQVIQLMPESSAIDSSSIMMALLKAVADGHGASAIFVRELERRLVAKEKSASLPDTKGE
jgi:hypothetical protein